MIESFSFGNIVVDGITYQHDIKIIHDHVVPQWWRKSGHRVDVEDVADLLAINPKILILGKGLPGFMSSSKDLQYFLASQGIRLIEQKTSRAIRTYNQILREGHDVAAGFHLGC